MPSTPQPPRVVVPPAPAARAPSLWHDLADGSAGPAVRGAVSVALAALFAGAAMLGSYVVAAWVPAWALPAGYPFFGPSDELVICMLVLAGVAYVPCLAWLWTRRRHRTPHFWNAAFHTALAVAATVILLFAAVVNPPFQMSTEYLAGAVACFGGVAIILVWVHAGRRYARETSQRNAADGALDVRCPACGYRMVGLRESRCPECGAEYTLDELLGKQGFFTPSKSGQPTDDVIRGPAATRRAVAQEGVSPT